MLKTDKIVNTDGTDQLLSMIDSERGIPVDALIKLLEVLVCEHPTVKMKLERYYEHSSLLFCRPKEEVELQEEALAKKLKDKKEFEFLKEQHNKEILNLQQKIKELDA